MHPFVYWAQTEAEIFLKVDIRNVQRTPSVSIEDEEIEFAAFGTTGAQGTQRYEFVIEFFLPVDPKKSSFEVKEREILIKLVKREADWWPRLLYEQVKLPWLKIDFDRWKAQEDSEYSDDDDEVGGNKKDISSEDFLRNKYPAVYEKLQKQELGYIGESKRKIYLFCYNLFMFCGFLYVFVIMNLRYAKMGDDFIPHTYKTVGNMMNFVHILMFLEVLHPIFGYTKGSALASFVQVGGRNFVLFFLVESETRMQEKPVIFYLFSIYCFVDVFRYPYYMLKVYDIEIAILTWFRYTVWIPMYPAAFICEGVIVLRNIPYFEESGKYTVSLPNEYNFAFHFPSLLRVYLLFVFFPMLYTAMQHMYQQRCKKLGIKQYSKNKKKED